MPSVEVAEQRVYTRIREGGHFVAPDVIKRHYKRGIENLYDFMKNVDKTLILDRSSLEKERFVAYLDNRDSFFNILDSDAWEKICNLNYHLKEFNLFQKVSYGLN